MSKLNKKQMLTIILWFAIAVIGRIIPHWPNATPLTALCLFAPAYFGKRFALIFNLIALCVSDIILAAITFNYPIFGNWSLFTYTGFVGIVLLGYFISKKTSLLKNMGMGIIAVLFYWIWTNFGVWILSNMYSHNLNGFIACYVAALPFLKYAFIGMMIWMWVLNKGLSIISVKMSTDQCKTKFRHGGAKLRHCEAKSKQSL